MKISRERLIDELSLKYVEVRELRDEVASLKKELFAVIQKSVESLQREMLMPYS